jgi:hypothetical protein
MPRMTPEDADFAARTIEVLFEDLNALRARVVSEEEPSDDNGFRTHEGSARVTLLNLLDTATEHDLKGTALSDLPPEGDGEAWEWLETAALAHALEHGMSALVRDMATLRSGLRGGNGRELDVRKFRLAWETLKKRLISGPGVVVTLQDGERGEVDLKVVFEPPMSNPFNEEDPDLSPAQVMVGNMMAYAFTRRNEEPVE